MVDRKIWYGLGALLVLVVLVVFSVGYFNARDNARALQTENAKLQSESAAQAQAFEATLQDVKSVVDAQADELQKTKDELQDTKDALDNVSAQRDELEAEKEDAVAESQAVDNGEKEVIDKLFIGDQVSFKVDDGDLQKLFDGEIEFNDDEYDVHEELIVPNGKAYILYSLIDDEELDAQPALGFTESGAVEYVYTFDDPIDVTDISDDEPLTLTFLGQQFDIVGVSDNEVIFRFGTEFYLNEGDSVNFNGQVVTLEVVGDNNRASVCVDGTCKTINEFDTEKINGVDVRVEDILSNNRRSAATLVLSDEDALIDQKDGDEFLKEVFGDDTPWDFQVVVEDDQLVQLSVVYTEKRKNVDDDYAPLFEGDSLKLPFDFLTVTFSDVAEDDYVSYDFQFDDFSEELENGDDVDKELCGRITTSDEDITVLDEDVDEVFVCADGTAYYQDTSGDWYETAVTDVVLENDDAQYALALNEGKLEFLNEDDVCISLDTDWENEQLGSEEDDAESEDIQVGGISVGNQEYSVLTPYGAVIVTPESHADRDEFTLKIPTDRVEIELSVA